MIATDRGVATHDDSPSRIVVATSGSRASHRATEVAGGLASALAAELTIVHVVGALEYRVGRFAPTLPITRRLDDPYGSLVLLDARRLAWAKGASARVVLISGQAPQAIVALASRLGAGLLVLGATRRRWPTSMAATTRRWVQSYAPCPVIAVPAEPLMPAPEVGTPRTVELGSRRMLPLYCCGGESLGCRCGEPVL
jgi:nucleotide-binding universal stress UspA family protein